MSTPVILIHSNANVDDLYRQALARNTPPRPQFEQLGIVPADVSDGVIAMAAHAGDGVIINGNYASTDSGSTWTHIERLVR